MAIKRVQQRAREGGHWIPNDVIIRRFRAGLSNLENLYKPIVDQWALYDNSQEIPFLIARGGRS